MNLKIVTPSRKRVESCARTVLAMPVDLVCVAQSEATAYKLAVKAPILTHPDEVVGGGAVFRWILENVKADCVVFCDDDITGVTCLVGRRPRKITDIQAIRRIIENTATVCQGIGARLFSFAITSNILDFSPYDPFNLAKGGGPVKGVFGKDGGFDPKLIYHIDGDLALNCLLRDRVVFKDTRFCFDSHVQTNFGGSQDLFSPEIFKRDCRYIAKKWGPPGDTWYLKDTGKKGVQGFPIVRMITCVGRRQKRVYTAD